jgi:O-methyltransferase
MLSLRRLKAHLPRIVSARRYQAMKRRIDPVAPAEPGPRPVYDSDSLAVWNKQVDFLTNPNFVKAYRAGLAGRHDPNDDIHIEWRIAISCWAAHHAVRLEGDFVECGVHTGWTSLAICTYVDFNRTTKSLWLFDTFEGIPEEQATAEEQNYTRIRNERMYRYRDTYELARRNFSGFPRAHLIRGKVPETLPQADIKAVAFLHIDMNLELPERAALEHFWPRLVPGGLVVLDDYGWAGHEPQTRTADAFAKSVGVEVWNLPTGQGLLIKR